jgi:hypothetical protein
MKFSEEGNSASTCGWKRQMSLSNIKHRHPLIISHHGLLWPALQNYESPFGLKEFQRKFRGWALQRIFSYTLVWFIGKSEECFPRNPFLSSISYRKRSKRRDLFFFICKQVPLFFLRCYKGLSITVHVFSSCRIPKERL